MRPYVLIIILLAIASMNTASAFPQRNCDIFCEVSEFFTNIFVMPAVTFGHHITGTATFVQETYTQSYCSNSGNGLDISTGAARAWSDPNTDVYFECPLYETMCSAGANPSVCGWYPTPNSGAMIASTGTNDFAAMTCGPDDGYDYVSFGAPPIGGMCNGDVVICAKDADGNYAKLYENGKCAASTNVIWGKAFETIVKPEETCTDADGDGYNGTPAGCDSDCDDSNSAIYPGATEVCNGIDDNCNGQTDEGVTTMFYRDADNDGYGNDVTVQACSAPAGYVAVSGDCNDNNAAVHPNAVEITCNGIDENCNGLTDDRPDSDGDGIDDCTPKPQPPVVNNTVPASVNTSNYSITASFKINADGLAADKLCPTSKRRCDVALAGAKVRLFNYEGSRFRSRWGRYDSTKLKEIYMAGTGMLDEKTTGSDGTVTFSVASKGGYLIIAEYTWTDSSGKTWTVYKGTTVSNSDFRTGNWWRGKTSNTAKIDMPNIYVSEYRGRNGVTVQIY